MPVLIVIMAEGQRMQCSCVLLRQESRPCYTRLDSVDRWTQPRGMGVLSLVSHSSLIYGQNSYTQSNQ